MSRRKHHHSDRDIFYTPDVIAKACIDSIPMEKNDLVCDCCKGVDKSPFYDNIPTDMRKEWYEIGLERDFLECMEKYDWVVGNIPFSMPKQFIEKMSDCSVKGFGILCLSNSMTTTRLKNLEKKGFFLNKEINLYIREWGFGYKTCFYVFTRTPSASFVNMVL